MRCIVIDVEAQEGKEAEAPDGLDAGLKFMQGVVGGFIEIAGHVQGTKGGVDTLYVDEEGLLKEKAGAFAFKGIDHQVFEGSGVILGLDDDSGDSVAAQVSLDEVRKRVRFVRP